MTDVIVIGAGLAGLGAAIGCAQHGWAVTVCERAPHFTRVGAGLTISPSAQAGLRWLGVQSDFDAIAEPAEAPVLLDWSHGTRRSPTAPAPHLDQVRRIARADLHAILVNRLRQFDHATLKMDAQVTAIRPEPAAPAAILADGSRLEGDILLGADGARSAVRDALFGDGQPAFTGFVAWRFLLPRAEADRYLGGHVTAITSGPQALLTTYTIAGGTLVNCVAITRSTAWAAEGWSEPGDKAELLAHFASAHADTRALIALAPDNGLFRWGLFDRPVRDGWHKGRAVLLGDAAHPVLPFLAYGAGLAIEDAVVLTRALALHGPESAPEAAFAAFERARAPRVKTIHAASRAQAGAFARPDHATAGRPAPFYDPSLFAYDPTTAPFAETDT